MDNGTYELLKTDIARAAKSVALHWPGTVDADDTEQELWAHLLERPGTVEKILDEMDDRQRYNAVVRIGHQIASQARDDYDAFTGNYRYGVGEVKALLEDGVLSEDRTDLSVQTVSGGVVNDNLSAEFESFTAENLDVHLAFQALTTRQQDLLRFRYVENRNLDSAERSAVSRAVGALTDGMNKVFRTRGLAYADGPGTRRSRTNASAIAITGKVG